VSYFPINIASYVYFDLVKILSFNNDKDENIDFDTLYKTVMNKYEKNGWPTPQSISIENKLLEKAISFKAKLENPEILESLIGFLKIVRLTVLNEYMTKITAKQNKNNGEIFHTAINYILLEEIISYIDMITQKKCAVVNDKNEQEEKELTDNEQKCLIGRWLIKLVCYLLFSGTSLRLSNDMSNTASSIKDINENDIQTFFSVIINGLILSIELIDNAEDKGKENDTYLDTVIPSERLKLLGSESSKIFYNGLKGMYVQNNEEKQDELFESTVSRLFVGRRELMEESVCFVENVLDIINKFIDEVSIGGTLMEKE
jgi:hypothetical protein